MFQVNFVDYGNNEVISWNNVRTDLIMQAFARQCIECKLAKIHTVSYLIFLTFLIVAYFTQSYVSCSLAQKTLYQTLYNIYRVDDTK